MPPLASLQTQCHVGYALFQFITTGRTRSGLRSTSSTDFSLPRLRTKFGERSFSHDSPAAWNDLPEDMRAEADTAKFRKQLKTHF